MAQIDLLRRYPKSKRNVDARNAAKTEENIRLSMQFGYDYFDGSRETGYGGYQYDGRWLPVAEDIIEYFGLVPNSRVLDVGCAKGFLVHDLMAVCPGLEAFGIDISDYALKNCKPEVADRLRQGSAEQLPYPDGGFDAVISINTLHNLERGRLIRALGEVERLAPGRGFVQVDSYRSEDERALFLEWALTPLFHDYPEGWVKLFQEAGYRGDYDWTFVQ